MWKDIEVQWQDTCPWADLLDAAMKKLVSEGCDPATAVVESADRDLVSFNAPRYVIRLRALRRPSHDEKDERPSQSESEPRVAG